MHRSAPSYIAPMVIGGILGVSLLYYFSASITHDEKFEELALGENNTAALSLVEQVEVHCNDLEDAYKCISGYKKFSSNNEISLWLGNSQLHTINQIKTGEELSSAIVHRELKKQQKYLLTFSQPNASLQEHYLLFEYLAQSIPISTLILSVVFDDLRETGIRGGLIKALNNEDVFLEMSKTDIGRILIANRTEKDVAGNDMAALNDTIQKQSENYLNGKLEKVWSIWKDRSTVRVNVLGNLYFFRNWVFGITPSSVRKMMPGRYILNIKALKAMIMSANQKNIKVLVYIAPIRNDFTIPYDLTEYESFKSDVALIVKKGSAKFVNLENLIPGKLWGEKKSTSIGEEEELDFMHFKAKGHRLLARSLLFELNELWGMGVMK